MKAFTVIIPTIGRKKELDNLLESIVAQSYLKLEVIIVDQNEDGYIKAVVDKYSKMLKISHEKVDFKGVARARNYGMKLAKGDIVCFPDDDSIMPLNTLKFVDEFFENNVNIQAVFGRVQDLNSKKDILHFKKNNTKIKLHNIYQTTIETSMFIRNETFKNIGMYDENLGLGTYYGAEEGADLVSRLLYKKVEMIYFAKPFSYHPNKRDYKLLNRAYSYNLGFGALVYKHIREYKKIYPMCCYFILKLFKNVLEMVIAFFSRNKEKFDYNFISCKGKIKGFLNKRKDYKNESCNCT